MKTFLANVAAIGLVLAAAGLVEAGGPGGHHGNNHNNNPTMKNPNYYPTYKNYGGYKFSHGTWYPKDRFYWNYYCYSPKYGCYLYWNPAEYCYYYWYPTANCYYPLTYITVAQPAVTTQVTTTLAGRAALAAQVVPPGPAMARPSDVPPAP